MVQNQLPLKGKIIAVTRPCDQAEEEAEIIKEMGGKPYFIPTIRIDSLTDLSPIKHFIKELAEGKHDYVVFMSVNGVKHLFRAAINLRQKRLLLNGLRKAVIVAVGPRTAEELKSFNVQVNLIPSKYTSEGVIESIQQLEVKGKRVAIPRTSAASPNLKEKLAKMGAVVNEVYVYDSAIPEDREANRIFLDDLRAGKIDAVVFGSGLCAKNLFQMLDHLIPADKLAEALSRKAIVCAIGPVTAEALRVMNVKVEVMPEKHTFKDAITALAQFWKTWQTQEDHGGPKS